jgi:hypothetical protein
MVRLAESSSDWNDPLAGLPTGEAYPISTAAGTEPAGARLRRLDRVAWILDRAIPIGRYRIGLDPIIGLLPGVGDWIGALLSVYVLYEGARLGAPNLILLRMTGNILVEAILGEIPLLGDVFDFVWQANTRNLALIHRHHDSTWEPRSLRAVWITVLAVTLLVLTVAIGLAVLLVKLVLNFEGFRW